MTRYYTLSLLVTGVFYIIITIYNFATNEQELIYFSTFCMIMWIVFHYFFVTIIYNMMDGLGGKTVLTSSNTSKLIEKDVKEPINS